MMICSMPQHGRSLPGVPCPISERQHALTLQTLIGALGVCADRASVIDALARTGVPLPVQMSLECLQMAYRCTLHASSCDISYHMFSVSASFGTWHC